MKNRLSGILTLLLALVVHISYAQQQTITGKVTDGEGLPLPGVNVVVQGTNTGTQTDFDGNYSIQASQGEVLVFSFVGFETVEYTVGNVDVIDLTLTEDAAELDEVVVVGYGTATKQSFTGTADVVDGEQLARKNVTDVSQALAGESAGVRVINTSGQPGEESTIRIRGFGSVNGNRDPLYVLDGVPYNGNITAINPADIESTTILKDAAATAIYGARGANGVIVINTKKGRSGQGSIEVETKTGVNFQQIPRHSVIESPEQYIGLAWEAMRNQGEIAGAEDPVAYANSNLFSSSGIDPKYNIWSVGADELIDPSTGMVNPGVSRRYNPEDWEEHAFQSSNRTETNLRISGGNDNTSYYTSFGYLDDEGYSINSDYERYSARLNVTHDVKDWLSGSMNIGYSLAEMNNGGQSEDSGSIFWFVDNIPSIYPLYERDAEGNFIPDPYYGGNRFDYGTGRGFGGQTNAIADATYGLRNSKRHEINGNAFLDFTITDFLSFETRMGTQYYNNMRTTRNSPFYGPSSSSSVKGSISKTDTELFSYNFLQLLRFQESFGDHTIEALLAHESNSWEQKIFYASKFNLVDPYGEELNNAVGSNPPGSYTRDYTLESFFGQVNYDFDDTYFLSGTLRRDGSSRFLKNKWGTFGSVGASWVVSNEAFMQDQNIFENLKLKASWGLIGEQGGVGFYPGYITWNIDNLGGNPAFSLDEVGNPDLTWETSNQFQVGLEFNVGGFLDGTIDYYVKDTEDLIFDRRVGPSLGYALIRVNDGALRNSGLEFDFTAHLVQTDDFYLDLGINGEILSNELTRMPIDPATGEEKLLDPQGFFGRAEGRSIYDFYMREWAGVDTQTGEALWNVHYVDANGNGSLDGDEATISSLTPFLANNPDLVDQIAVGTTTNYAEATQKFLDKSIIPDVRGAINLFTGYKGFDLSAQMVYGIGGYAYDFVYQRMMHDDQIGSQNWHTDILDRWQQPGDVTDVPRLTSEATNNGANVASSSDRFLEKADYLALNNVRLGYNFSQDLIENIGLSGLSLWVSGDNLFMTSARKGFNPSTAEDGSSTWYNYAPLTTITGGVRVQF